MGRALRRAVNPRSIRGAPSEAIAMASFKKATKVESYLHLALCGASGSGKTYTALMIAKHLGDRVAVIDTERGSASKYAGDVADFETLELGDFAPKRYIDALKAAANEGFPVVIIDSLSHAWMGKGGLLDQADARGGKFDAWRLLTPQHHDLVDAILAYPGHVIVTMRTKTEYVVEKDEKTGKMAPRKIGLAPVQKDGMEYEFDVVGYLDTDNTMRVEKSRCPALSGAIIRRPGEDVAKALKEWLSDGQAREMPPLPVDRPASKLAPEPPKSEPRAIDPAAAADDFAYLKGLVERGELVGFADLVKTAKTKGSISPAQVDALRALYGAKKGKAA